MEWEYDEMIFALYTYFFKTTNTYDDYQDELGSIHDAIHIRFGTNRTISAINSMAIRFYEVARYYNNNGSLIGFVPKNSSTLQIETWERVIINQEYGIYDWNNAYSVVDFGHFLETQLFPARDY